MKLTEIIKDNLSQLQKITSPFAESGEHVQGPGGNTYNKVKVKIFLSKLLVLLLKM